MALYPWRFQADIPQGETDPAVTVFIGAERAVVDDNGEPTAETFIQQDTSNPVIVKLSELSALLTDLEALTRLRAEQKARATPSHPPPLSP